jgi:hypothetical protein
MGMGGGFERLHFTLESFFDTDGDVTPCFLKSYDQQVGVMHAHAHTRTRAHTHARTRTRAHAHAHKHTRTSTSTRAHAHAHAHTHTHAFDQQMPWDSNPLYALMHESIYCQGAASNWAAHRVRQVGREGRSPLTH